MSWLIWHNNIPITLNCLIILTNHQSFVGSCFESCKRFFIFEPLKKVTKSFCYSPLVIDANITYHSHKFINIQKKTKKCDIQKKLVMDSSLDIVAVSSTSSHFFFQTVTWYVFIWHHVVSSTVWLQHFFLPFLLLVKVQR